MLTDFDLFLLTGLGAREARREPDLRTLSS